MSLKGIKRQYRTDPKERKKFLRRKPSSKRFVQLVLRNGHVPILYFCFNRRSCEYNAEMHSELDLLNDDEHTRCVEMVNDLVKQYTLSEYDKLPYLRNLWESGTAFHHAGILPAAKEIVERLFTAGLIKLLFCTETFALGVNMLRVRLSLMKLEKFDGVQFNYLLTREYNQMAGRAGRREWMKKVCVYSQIIPEATDPRELERLSPAEMNGSTAAFMHHTRRYSISTADLAKNHLICFVRVFTTFVKEYLR
jgi:ATP-dependent RNA helicase DOB1